MKTLMLLFLTSITLMIAPAHATFNAPPPKAEELCRAWLGMVGSVPLAVELQADRHGWVTTLSNGALALYFIENWTIKGYDISFTLRPVSKDAGELSLSGTGIFGRLVLRAQGKYFSNEVEFVLEDMAFVRKRLEDTARVFSDRPPVSPAPAK